MRLLAHRSRPILLLILLLAFGLRVAYLDGQSLWSDEFLSLDRSRVAFGDLLGQLPVEHVPLYFWSLRAWTLIAGDTDFALRFVSVVWSTLAVALLYRLAARLAAPAVAVLAAFLLAINPLQVWYAQEARMYAMLVGLSLIALLGLDIALTSPRGRVRGASLYVAASLAAMYAQYYGVLVPALGFLYAPWRIRYSGTPRGLSWRFLMVSHAAIAVLAIPWLLRLWRIQAYRSPMDFIPDNPIIYPAVYHFGRTLPDSAFIWLGASAFLLTLVGLIGLAREGQTRRDYSALVLVVFALLVPLAISLVLVWRGSVFHPRYYMAATPLFSLVVAQAIVSLSRRRLPIGTLAAVGLILASVVSLRLWYTDPTYAKAEDKLYMTFILDHAGPNQALVLDGPEVRNLRRYGSDEFERTLNLRGRLRDQGIARAVEEIAEVAEEHPVIWLITRPPDEMGEAKTWLDRHGYQAARHRVRNLTIYGYAFPRVMPAPRPPQAVTAVAPVELAWSAVSPAAEGVDGVAVALYWRPTGEVPPDAKVSLRLYDSDSHLVAQRDRTPGDGALAVSAWRAGDTVTDRLALGMREELPPGEYTLQAILYDPATQTELLNAQLGNVRLGL